MKILAQVVSVLALAIALGGPKVARADTPTPRSQPNAAAPGARNLPVASNNAPVRLARPEAPNRGLQASVAGAAPKQNAAPPSPTVIAMAKTAHAAGFGAGVAVTLAIQPVYGKKAFLPVIGPKIENAANNISEQRHPVLRLVVHSLGEGAAAAPPATERAEDRVKAAWHAVFSTRAETRPQEPPKPETTSRLPAGALTK
jgi:hypothetical protein